MKTRTALLALLLAALLFAAASPLAAQSSPDKLYDKQYALVIGISTYKNASEKRKHIPNAVNDAKEFAAFLKDSGFQVQTLYNEKAVRTAILGELKALANTVGEEDAVIVFFAGHGATEKMGPTDEGFIVPYEATFESSTYIAMSELERYSKGLGRAKHQLFIMDSCYGGSLGSGTGGDTRSSKAPDDEPEPPPKFAFIREITKPKARQVLTAGGKDQEVLDGSVPIPGRSVVPECPGHSIFTCTLLKGLREKEADSDGDGFITFSELRYFIRTKAFVKDRQTPHSAILADHVGDKEFVFAANRIRVLISSRIEPMEGAEGTKRVSNLQMSGAEYLQRDLSGAQRESKISSVRFDLEESSEGIVSRGERGPDAVAESSEKQSDYILELRYLPLEGQRVQIVARFRKSPSASKDAKVIPDVRVELEKPLSFKPLVAEILRKFAPETFTLHLESPRFAPNCPPELREQLMGEINGWVKQIKLPQFRYSEEKYDGTQSNGVAIRPIVDYYTEGGQQHVAMTLVVEQRDKERQTPSKTAPKASWTTAFQQLRKEVEEILTGMVK